MRRLHRLGADLTALSAAAPKPPRQTSRCCPPTLPLPPGLWNPHPQRQKTGRKTVSAKKTATALLQPHPSANSDRLLDDAAGYPDRYAKVFRSYIRAPGDRAVKAVCEQEFDVVLIDGRARLFCAEYAIKHPRMRKAVILIHDFRPSKRYCPILDRCRIIGSVESGRSVVALEPI